MKVDFAASHIGGIGRKVISRQRERAGTTRRKKKTESYSIGELSLSVERVNKETAVVLIVEFSMRVGGKK